MAGEVVDYHIPSLEDREIDGQGDLLLFPGITDPHICFGAVGSENWNLAVQSAVRGGITTAIEVPNASLPHSTKEELQQKDREIVKSLSHLQIPFRYTQYLFYSEANVEKVDQLGLEKSLVKGLVIHVAPNKKNDLDPKWERLFRAAAQQDIPLVFNAFHENRPQPGTEDKQHPSLLEKVIDGVEKCGNRLYVLNVAMQDEIQLIQSARKKELLVYAETTPQHLFSDDAAQTDYLWDALNRDLIETIGSGYDANQPSRTRAVYHGANFGFLDPVFLLPLLLTAVREKKITLDKLIQVTSLNIQDILGFEKNSDFVLVDLKKEQTVRKIRAGRATEVTLIGWPVYTIIQGSLFAAPQTGYRLE